MAVKGAYSNARDDNRVPTISGLSSADLLTPLSPKVISTTNRLAVDSVTDVNTTFIVQDGTKLTAGTNVAVQLTASSTACKKVVIYAYSVNTDTVAIGTSTVLAQPLGSNTLTGRGEQLMPAAATTVTISDISLIWLASARNGDGVSYVAYS